MISLLVLIKHVPFFCAIEFFKTFVNLAVIRYSVPGCNRYSFVEQIPLETYGSHEVFHEFLFFSIARPIVKLESS